MNKEIKKIWTKALVSGKYKQATSFLKKEGKFCCLGVLCDLYRKKNKKGTWGMHEGVCSFKLNGKFDNGVLPSEVRKWAGLKTNRGEFTVENIYGVKGKQSLVCKNDSGSTFKEIAEIINKHF